MILQTISTLLHVFAVRVSLTLAFSQDETSEKFIGEWAEGRGIRDQLFIATKVLRTITSVRLVKLKLTIYLQFTNNPKLKDPNVEQRVLYSGNNAKSMHLTIESSLKKLRTTYIDLFYVHFWDYTTNIPELMQALHALVLARKVLYLVSPRSH